jgi:hypothetical protein
MVTVLLHEWQALGSNPSSETGYFGFLKRKNTCVKSNTRPQVVPYR